MKCIPELSRKSLVGGLMRRLIWLASMVAGCTPILCQINVGELRLEVKDRNGFGLTAKIEISSLGNDYKTALTTADNGRIDVPRLPYGVYIVSVRHSGFADISQKIEVRSAVPIDLSVTLAVKPVETVVDVKATSTLIDPERSSSVMQIGTSEISTRVASLPGRSLQDLVNSQPGWLYEGNAVLHPRGSEYQTQFVVDGIPLTENRSPGFGPEIEADDVDSMSIYTAGIPAEYGRKMGGVIEVNTRRDPDPGLHGDLVLSGGSFDTEEGYAHLQDSWGKSIIGATASGSMTARYLSPVVPDNYTNRGTTGDFSLRDELNMTSLDRLTLAVRHELSRFQIPDEYVQEKAGQLQTGNNFETISTAGYQHIFSSGKVGTLAAMLRESSDALFSNQSSTPIIAFEQNHFLEAYFKAAFSLHHGNQEYKAGWESENAFLHENFNYLITDPTQFDSSTPANLTFHGDRPDLEQAAFVEDTIRLGRWTVGAGLRWDHYQLLLNQKAFSPRISLGYSIPAVNMLLHASYDRVFQTPSFENILISSSPQIDSLSGQFLRLPVKPSRGNYYEGGMTEGIAGRLRLDLNVYRRNALNYADDDQLLNTGVTYPIAFDKAVIYGAEGKLELVKLGNLNGFVTYSYMVGNASFPVTGGLFLGEDARAAQSQLTGHFPDSQDQRNTLRTRFMYRPGSRFWLASGASYGSGLPFKYEGNENDALVQYGPAVTNRINFDRGRIRPSLSVNASLGVDFGKLDKLSTRLQVDGNNLTNRLNVIDFGGLFSGNAIGPPRSFSVRLNTAF